MERMLILALLSASASASTHWVVTEEGKVQEQLESPFAINQPHDLVAFMKQENNYRQAQDMKEMLLKEKKAIEENEDKEIDLEGVHYRQDEDCRAAGKPLTDFDLFVSSALPLENKGIEISDYIDTESPPVGTTLYEPNCEEMIELPYSIHAYDHLQGVINRKDLHYLPETGLKTTLNYMKTEEEFANAINSALKKDPSSWVAYNLATFYWRMKGKAECAMECVRRALHFTPTEYKDVALVNLANILHRSHYSLNASVVMTHAIDISSQFNVNHFTLASIYAALGEYNSSIYYFEKTVENQAEFEAAKKRLHAVKCQHKLQKKLEIQHESLQKTLRDLQEYQEKHKKYLELQMTIEKMQLSRQEQINMHFQLMQHLIKHGTFDHKLCKFRSNESGPVMFCNLPAPTSEEPNVDLDPNLDERDYVIKANPTKFAAGPNAGTFKPSGGPQVQYNNWNNPEWPTDKHCAEYAPRTLAWDEYPSSYINPQTRGYSVHDLLTSYIGIEDGENMPLPWDELNCEMLEPVTKKSTIDRIPSVTDRHSAPMHKQDEYMKREMLMHVNEGHVWPGDLGHRIHTAITKSLKHKDKERNLWLLYNYAGLFFRVQGDNLKAVECIRRAAHRTPTQNYDIPLVNLANIMYRLGKVNDALNLLIEALNTNNTEAVTYLATGNALLAKGNVTGAIAFYEYALMLRPNYWESFHALINAKCTEIRDKRLQEEQMRTNHRTAKSSKQSTREQEDESQDDQMGDSNDKSCDSEGDSQTTSTHVNFQAQDNDSSESTDNQVTAATAVDVVYPVHTFTSQETSTAADCENASNGNDLVRRLESKKEDADRILQDADKVIQRLAHVAEDNTEELSVRVSTAREIMQQLSNMRDSLGSLVQQASSTLDREALSDKYKDISPRVCTQALHTVDLHSYLPSNVDVLDKGYDFGEELPLVPSTSSGHPAPICHIQPENQGDYNMDHLESLQSVESFGSYSEEHGMRTLLKQLVGVEEDEDFSDIIRRLSEGLTENPSSWRLAVLASYYWRLHGKAKEAIDCLRLALVGAPDGMRNVVLIGLANVLAQIAQWKDAIYVAEQAITLSPDTFIHRFTLANILAAKGDISKSIPHFKLALDLKPGLEIVKKRLEAAFCEQQRIDNY